MKNNKRISNLKKATAILLVISFVLAMLPSFVVMANSEDVIIIREETELRTANEKHFLCSDGTMMAVAYSGDVHYLDKDGKYQNIDNTLEYNSTKGQYRSTGNPNFKVIFASSANTPGVALEDKNGNVLYSATTVEMNSLNTSLINGLKLNPVNLSVTNPQKVDPRGKSRDSAEVLEIPELRSELKYQNVFGLGISAEYVIEGDYLKENIIFNSKTEYSSINTMYSMEDLVVEVTESGALILGNSEGEALFLVDAPYMYDASGSVCPRVEVTAERTDNGWNVSYVPDAEWRNSPERVYPVVFDPMTGSATNSNITDMYNKTVNGNVTEVINDTTLKSGIEWLSTDNVYNIKVGYRTFIKPTVYPEIPAGNTILSVGLKLTKSSVVGSGYLEAYKIGGNADFENNDYSSGSWLGAISYSSSNTASTYTFNLPASEYNNCGEGYVIKDSMENTSTVSDRYVVFHSSSAVLPTNRPKIVVTYVPEGINNKVTLLKNSVTNKYMSAASESIIEAAAEFSEKSLWKFIPVGIGSFQIQSHYYDGKCIGANSSGNISLVDAPTSNFTDKSLLWYLTVTETATGIKQYTLVNEQYGVGLYVSGNENAYTCRIDTGLITGTEIRKWEMSDLMAEMPIAEASFGNVATNGFLTTDGEMNLTVLNGITKDEPWQFITYDNNTFRIISGNDNEKCLAVSDSGSLSLADVTTSSNDRQQLWYFTVNGDGYSVMNVATKYYLYVITDVSGNKTYALDTTGSMSAPEQRQWKLMDYFVPTEVSTLSSLANPNLFLKNESGKNYNGTVISVGEDKRGTSDQDISDIIGDKCGFRILYDVNETDNNDIGYRIMPISSANGYHRAIGRKDDSNTTTDLEYNVILLNSTNTSYTSKIQFLFELQTDGSFVIRLKSNSELILTDNGNGQIVTLKETTNSQIGQNQKWTFNTYEYFLTNGEKTSYSDIEEYYRSKQFMSPFGTSNYSLVMTSDFGPRTLTTGSSNHRGLDLMTGGNRNLYSPVEGKIIAVKNNYGTNTGSIAEAGNYIVIETNIPAYNDDSYKVCIVYMHMSSVDVIVGQEISAGTKVGKSGWSGLFSSSAAHLHIGVFLKKTSMSSTSWNTYPINPLWFYEMSAFNN